MPDSTDSPDSLSSPEGVSAQKAWELELLAEFANEATRNRAFTKLMERYRKALYWHIRRMVLDHDETDDLLQNTFIRCYQSLDRFEARSGLYTWLYRIATNLCLSHLSQKKRRRMLSLSDDTVRLEAELKRVTPQERLGSPEYLLEKALLKLPPKQRLVFQMRYYDELPYEQMSEILGTSEGALKASYHLAFKKVEAILKRR
ncbi:MAG: RNA polymerase sigma factor [Bacteroidota bacterium]